MKSLISVFCAALAGLLLAGVPAAAQGPVAVNVGTIESTRTCTYFRNYEGSRLTVSESEYARVWGAAAARRFYAAHTTWRSYVVRDCQNNFETLRSTIEAALASTGRLTSGRGGYTLDVTISDISSTPPATNRPVSGDNAYRTSWGTATASVSYTLRDSSGASVDGGVFTKRIEMSRTLDTDRMRVRTSEPGAAVYDLMQNEVSMQIAREVAFAIDPMVVTAVEGDLIEVNYGAPLLSLGDQLDVKRSRGVGAIRYRVISTTDYDATAQVDGDNDTFEVDPGNEVTYVEGDSDAANARRYRRQPLP